MDEPDGAASPGWDEIARRYRKIASGRSPSSIRILRAEVLRLAGRVCGRRVLDVGCEQGALVRRIAERGGRVVGIDASPQAIEQARADLELVEVEHRPELLVASIDQGGGLPPGPFDLLTSLAPAQGAELTARMLRSLAARLRRGGRLVLAFPHPYQQGVSSGRLLQRLFGWLRASGLRVVDLVEIGVDGSQPPEFAVLLAERPRRPPRRRQASRPAPG